MAALTGNTPGANNNKAAEGDDAGVMAVVAVAIWEREKRGRKECREIHFSHLIWHHSSGSMWWENLRALSERRRSAPLQPAPGDTDVTACKIESSQCNGISRWVIALLMSGRRQTSRQLSPSRLRWRACSAEVTSNDRCRSELINGVLVYSYQNVPQLTTCLWHLSNHPQQKYWHRETGGNEATTEDINPLWDTLPPGLGLLKQ